MPSFTLETLTPEIQALVMRNIDTVRSLKSLLHASPRLFQVFRTRREYLLTQVAFNQFHPDVIEDVWTLTKALQIPRSAPLADIHDFVNDLSLVDNNYEQHSMPPSTIIPLCKVGTTIAWFIEDYKRSSLELLTDLGKYMDLQQDTETLESDLSIVEKGRLQRAFCRFETCCRLYTVAEGEDATYQHFCQARRYLRTLLADDVEEIACIRDYLVRRLWGVFEAMEDRAVQEDPGSTIRKLGNVCQPHDWFSRMGKLGHRDYMEYILSQGLGFLREVLESDGLKRAEIVISHSTRRTNCISKALSDEGDKSSYEISVDYDAGSYDGEGDYIGDGLDNLSQGLVWANDHKVPSDWGRWPLKGLRDWGYMFWGGRRLQASGVLDQE